MLTAGDRLGGFEIIGVVGAGGMGVVYRARDLKLRREVALKVLPSEFAADEVRLQRFQREAQAVAALNHPNVVTIYSVEESNRLHFLVMELVEGTPLANLIPPGGLPLGRVLQYALPITDAIVAAHQQAIVHRDLKPANVMVRDDGRVKVLDFGLAKLAPAMARHADGTTELLTADHHVVGTTGYMSPEQAEGRIVDARSDIFSLGVMLYEMAAGARPFKGDSSLAILSSILKDDPQPLTTLKRDLPPDFDRVVRRCLAKDPARRYQTALDVRNELDDLQRQTGARSTVAAAPRITGTAALSIAAAVVLAIAVAAWRFGDRDPDPVPAPASFRQLTSQPGAEIFGRLSPDGQWVVYTGEGQGHRDIYLHRIGGQTPINLTADSAADEEQPAFSPDGERIVFWSSRDGGGLFVMGRTGEAVRRITREGFNPDWSPDGTQVVFTSARTEFRPQNAEQRGALKVVAVDGGEPRQIYESGMMPRWSPSGARLAFATRRSTAAEGSSNIVTMPAQGGDIEAVTHDEHLNWNPVWSPDGTHLFFVSNRGGSPNIWRVEIDERSGRVRGEPRAVTTPASIVGHLSISADGRRLSYSAVTETQNIEKVRFDPIKGEIVGEPQSVTTGSRFWANPDPSPDGTQVVVYSQIAPEGDLYISRTDGSGALRQLTDGPATDRVPRWSPDGQWIATFSDRSKRLQVWMIRADGSDLRQVTTEPSSIVAWSPDGRRMAVARQAAAGTVILNPHDDPEGASKITLPTPKQLPFLANSWSPDGKQLAGQTNFNTPGILMYSIAEQRVERLADFGEWPVWLPDSRRLLFVSRPREFHIVDTHTKVISKIWSSVRDTLGPPRLTRDGRMMFYQRRSTEADVWVATLR
ncbi:MAG TPA: protein kinase [Vicinamibacterales bacterium]|nr:protein kinase [Vicinamibacterales bacterium]